VNHRVLERTLRPSVFRRACLSERRFLLAVFAKISYIFFVETAELAVPLARPKRNVADEANYIGTLWPPSEKHH
jgi:hypothetical protein